MDKDLVKLLTYKQLMQHPKSKWKWSTTSAKRFGQLSHGVGGQIKQPTNTIHFVRDEQVPKECKKDAIYGSFVCTVRPQKAEPNRTRFTVGGDKINYPGEVATLTVEIMVAKFF